jgi:hypothetical protein
VFGQRKVVLLGHGRHDIGHEIAGCNLNPSGDATKTWVWMETGAGVTPDEPALDLLKQDRSPGVAVSPPLAFKCIECELFYAPAIGSPHGIDTEDASGAVNSEQS